MAIRESPRIHFSLAELMYSMHQEVLPCNNVGRRNIVAVLLYKEKSTEEEAELLHYSYQNVTVL